MCCSLSLPVSRLSGSACWEEGKFGAIWSQTWSRHCQGGWAELSSRPLQQRITASTSAYAKPEGWESVREAKERKAAWRAADEAVTEADLDFADTAIINLQTVTPGEPTIELFIDMQPTEEAMGFLDSLGHAGYPSDGSGDVCGGSRGG